MEYVGRISRKESTGITRQKLLAAASKAFLRQGYTNTRIDGIAEAAGFTRGAFYAHFASKQEVFFALISDSATRLTPGLIESIEDADDRDEAIDAVCRWANARADAQDMGLLMVEALQQIRRTGDLDSDHLQPPRENWRRIGEALLPRLGNPQLDATAEEIGAIVLELTYAPSLGSSFGPPPARLLRVTLQAFGG